MVDVSNKHKSITVGVSSKNGNTVVAASSDTSQYWANQSHTFANQSKESAQDSKHYAELANSYIEGFEDVVTNNTNNIIATSNDCINQIAENTGAAIDSINSTKTTILNDIEFVADGEKKEIEDLIDNGKEELKESIGDVKVLTTLEIGDIGFTQMAIDETKGKRRVLNGQLIIQDQYVQFTNIIKNSVALNPDLACTESEWQTELTMSANGVCYKYVIDDEAGTIRLPKYPDYLDLSINGAKTVSVYGTGKGLGLINGSQTNIGAFVYGGHLYGRLGLAGRNVGAGSDGNGDPTNNQVVGFSKDPSLSGLTGSVTTSSEQIKGTYFIQVATGSETEDNIINEIELNNPFSLLDYKYSEYELNNLSWLRSEGQYNSKAVYPAVYDLLLKIYNGTETKAGVSVKLTTETFTDYDFVLNTAEEAFRLPVKVKLANLTSEGIIPVYATDGSNKTYNFTTFNGADNYGLYDSMYLSGAMANNTKSHNFTMKADLSQVVNSDLYLYFYVGETVQNANLVNIGRIQEHYTTKSMVDGQWTQAYLKLITSKTSVTNAKPLTFDLSTVLPNDGYNYECIFDILAETGTASGNSVEIMTFGGIAANGVRVCKAITRTTASAQAGGQFIEAIGTNRTISLQEAGGTQTSYVYFFRLLACRRIGTNL